MKMKLNGFIVPLSESRLRGRVLPVLVCRRICRSIFLHHLVVIIMLSIIAIISLLILMPSASLGGQFQIDYEHNTFIMDGKPFRYVSGSMHYFRCPHEMWRDRLRKMRLAGLNAISTYVEWSQHEKTQGNFDFSGDLDLVEFINLAASEGLYVILRPGPYICAERDFGGFPPWLLKQGDIRLRSSDARYQDPVRRWFDVLLPKISPLLYGNGGPVILVQVENEYGSYPACDGAHLIWLRDLIRRHLGDDAVLFTTDGAAPSYLKCGKIPGVYATVDFGPEYNITYAFQSQRKFEPRGPLVNSEYYPGWLTHWGESRAEVNASIVASSLRTLLQMNANVNFYMFHGGSNFGFTAGANFGNKYQSDITSYDYDAPLTEAGDLTPKYYEIRKVISEFLPRSVIKKLPVDVAPKGDYGTVQLDYTASLLSTKVKQLIATTVKSTFPETFEKLENYFGYVLYETPIPDTAPLSAILAAEAVNDRGTLFINDQKKAVLSREDKVLQTKLELDLNSRLGILVENLGRINYGPYLNDTKGLGNVSYDSNLLMDWTMTKFNFDSLNNILSCDAECRTGLGFRFFVGKFALNSTNDSPALDSFIDVSNLKKGLVFLNDHNLGRYWSSRGPQFSLYAPGVWFNAPPLENVLVIFDEYENADSISVTFSKVPIWAPNP